MATVPPFDDRALPKDRPRRRPRRPGKIISFVLAGDDYDVLAARAFEQDRDPFQHACWLVRRALGVVPPVEPDEPCTDGGAAEGER
jgi:hypothetical protein